MLGHILGHILAASVACFFLYQQRGLPICMWHLLVASAWHLHGICLWGHFWWCAADSKRWGDWHPKCRIWLMNHWWIIDECWLQVQHACDCCKMSPQLHRIWTELEALKPLTEAEVEIISWKAKLRLSESLRSGAAILLWSLSPPGQEISDMWRQRAIDFQAFSYNMSTCCSHCS